MFRAVIADPLPDPLPEPTLLERQQILVADPSQQTFWHRVRFELVARHADELGATQVVDIGAGAGALGDWMLANRTRIEYRFEELSAVLDRRLTERFGAHRRTEPSSPLPSGSLVALLDVLEHVEHDVAALTAIRMRMTPGAHVVITVPALQWAFSSWDTELGHHRRYNRRTLRTVVEAAGFQVDSVAYLFPELLPLLPVRKLRRSTRSDVDFPQLGPLLTRVGYRISTATTKLRRVWPSGTSVLLTATNPAADDPESVDRG
ncbi:MAG: methyltransferase type 11 [Acidimicrobiaceae bacterium]|nr:MAG: methyltransferase type 11 [Acidimicrobiaceae bacterium]